MILRAFVCGFLTLVLAWQLEASDVVTEEIKYEAAGKKMTGFLAKPLRMENKAPAVLVVHEWWGQTDYPRKRAKMLAELGYVAFAVDMYGDRKISEHPKDAGAFAGEVMKSAEAVAIPFAAALATLKKEKNVDQDNIAAIGYCFGGSVVLEMARQGVDLKGVAAFHAGLKTPTAWANKIKAQILVQNGAKDVFLKEDEIQAFQKEMTLAKVSFEYVSLKDAVHGYSNPDATALGKKFNMPIAYNEAADKESWDHLKAFLSKIFASGEKEEIKPSQESKSTSK